MNKIPVKNQFLETRNEDSKPIKYTENDIVNTSQKTLYEIFKQYTNAELKLKSLEETNRYTAQKNNTPSFNAEDLETLFNTDSYWLLPSPTNKSVLGKRR